MDHFISADWQTGIVVTEAGVTLEELLRAAIPRGWFVPVTPGTKYVTVGGAIANDVHGKNHHRRGTFGMHVLRFGLLRSDAGRMTCSPAEGADLYNATIGGLGLTGVIEWAEIQLVPIRSSQLDQVTQRFDSLDEFFALSAELDETHEFCVSWIDCVAKGKATGRGVYSAANFSSEGSLAAQTGRKFTFPATPPVSLVNHLSLRAFNQLYWHRASSRRSTTQVGYDKFFYPLDALLQWNRIYGPRGFQQYQALIPERNAPDGIRALLTAIAGSGSGSFLAVLKRCGDLVSPGLLSFPKPGTSLALDFPQTGRLSGDLFPKLDAIVREAGGCLYPAKDAHMTGEDFRRSYPAWTRVEALRDPALLSRFWSRVVQ
jgi:FAD/FMN-containing dehydrogenase